MITKEKKYISPEEYLKFERGSETKHEYFNGEIFAMSGASINHNMITVNLIRILSTELIGTSFLTFGSDMRVYIAENGLYTYPDVSVFSGEVKLLDDEEDTALYPKVIFEVLSKSTNDYDRGGKFKLYRDIPSLRDYILIAQNTVNVEHFRNQSDGKWLLEEFKSLKAKIELTSIGCELKLIDLYNGVKL